jgi:hypothetical protein
MSYYPYYNYGYMPPNGPPCSDSNIQYQAQQPGQAQQQPCPTNIQYQQINGCAPFNPCSLDPVESTTDVMSGTVPYLNKDKTAYTTSNNITYDPDAHGGKGKFYIKGGFDPMYVQVEPQASNPNVGQTGTIWYDKDDNNLYIDNNALVKNGSNYIQLKRHNIRPSETAGQTGTIWIKEAANGDKSLYIDDKIVSGGAGTAASSGGLGLGATGTSVTLFSSVTNPKPEWVASQVTPAQNPGTLWVNPQGSLMFNEVQVIGPAGTALYATDPWITKYMLGQPPIPIQQPENKQTLVANGTATPNSEYSSTTTDIDIRWTPPEQRYIGLIDTAIPVIKEFQIRVIDSTAGTPITTVILDTRTASPAIRAAILPTKLNRLLINKSSTATPSDILTPVTLNGVSYTTLKWYKGTAALVEPLRVELWYENSGNYDNVATPAILYNKLSINGVRFSPPGPPSIPLVTSAGNPTDTTISINLSVPLAVNGAGGGYTDRFNLNNDSPIKFYNIFYKAISTRKTSGINNAEQNILNVELQVPQSTLANNYLVNYTIMGLNPVTEYEIQITARSDALQTRESSRSTAIRVETLIPAPVTTSQIENINLANNFTAIYKNTAYNPITNTQIDFTTTPILSTNIEWFLNLGPVYISLEPETTYSKIKVTLDAQDNTSDILDNIGNVPHILYGNGTTVPVVGSTGSLTNPSTIKIELYNGNTSNSGTSYTNTTIVDPNSSGAASGLYLQSYFGIKGKIPGFGASSILNTLLIGLITGRNSTTLNTINKSVNFYIDSLPIGEKPIFLNAPGPQANNMVLQNTSLDTNTINVCGLGLNNGNWQLEIANIRTKHVIYYFYNNPILEYKFANMPDFITLLGNPTPTEISTINAADGTVILYPLLPGNTPPITGKTISGTEAAFKYLPTISIKANNINKLDDDNTFTVEYPIKMIIDPKSVNAVNNSSNSTLMDTGLPSYSNKFLNGQRMLTSRKSNFYNFITDYRTCRHIFDNTNCMLGGTPRDINASPWDSSTDPIIYAANDLQLMNGKFMTRGYCGSGSEAAYKKYSVVLGTQGFATPDYSNLVSETKYRYVTMRWNFTAASAFGIQFQINGIDCSGATPLTIDRTSGQLYIGTGVTAKKVLFYYRVEQEKVAGISIPTYSSDQGNDLTYGNPSNIPFSLSNGFGLSTVWINAHSTNNNGNFNRFSSIFPDSNTVTDDTQILGGLYMTTNAYIDISGNKPSQTVTYNVTTPVFDLRRITEITKRYVNIYAMVGIPMDADIAFTNIQCKVIDAGESLIPAVPTSYLGNNIVNVDQNIGLTFTNDYDTSNAHIQYINSYNQLVHHVIATSDYTSQVNGGTYTSSDIIIRDTGSIQTRRISHTNYIFVSPDPQTEQSKIAASLQSSTSQIVYDVNNDVQAYNIPNITSSSDNTLVLSNQLPLTGIIDAYQNGISSEKGYYMISKVNLDIRTNNTTGTQIIARNNPYQIQLSQIYKLAANNYNSQNDRIINLFVDKLPINTAPNISSFIVESNDSNMQRISGVRVNNGNWSIKISKVVTTNTIYYLYRRPILQYTFMPGVSGLTVSDILLNNSIKTSSTGNITFFDTSGTPVETPQVISGVTQILQYIFRPTITITANNINKTNNTHTTTQRNIEIILDYPSYNLISTFPTADPAPGLPTAANASITTATWGKKMKTDTASYISTIPIVDQGVTRNVKLFLNNYNVYRTAYDHTQNIFTEASNDLQIVGGAHVSASYNPTSSYINYISQNGPDYSTIRSNLTGKYRWATFKWKYISLIQSTRLEFYIDGINIGANHILVRSNPTTGSDGLYIKNTLTNQYYPIEFYYRFEQPGRTPSGGQEGDPYNVLDTSLTSGADSISSIWINAMSSYYNSTNFGKLLGVRAYSGLLGGISGIDSDITISSTSPSFVKLQVSTPTLNLNRLTILPANRFFNIYTLIGLPMDAPIAFTGIKCNTYVGS